MINEYLIFNLSTYNPSKTINAFNQSIKSYKSLDYFFVLLVTGYALCPMKNNVFNDTSVYLLLEIRLMTIQLSGLLCNNCLSCTQLSSRQNFGYEPRTDAVRTSSFKELRLIRILLDNLSMMIKTENWNHITKAVSVTQAYTR